VNQTDWFRLHASDEWKAMWDAPDSAVRRHIADLEAKLHDTRIADAQQILGFKHELAALKWLHETVTSLAEPRVVQGPDLIKQSRLRRFFDSVLPATLG
jgi:hypothetical protein